MKLETKFSLGDRVWITELRVPARVLGLHIDEQGISYRLRWFDNKAICAGYLYEDEVETPPESEKKVGFAAEPAR